MEYSLNTPNTKMEYFRGFKAFLNAPNLGSNLFIGSVHTLIPVVGPIVLMGWGCEIMQRLSRNHPQPIPKLDFADFTHYLGRGVIPFLISFIAQFAFMIVLYTLFFAGVFSFGLMMESMGGSDNVGPIVPIVFFSMMALVSLAVLIPVMIVSLALQTFAELTEDFSRSFNFTLLKNYLALTWKKAFIAYLIYLPLSVVLIFVGMMACYVGIFPLMVILTIAFLYIRWQLYAYYLASGGTPLEVKAPVVLPSEQRAALPQMPPPPAR